MSSYDVVHLRGDPLQEIQVKFPGAWLRQYEVGDMLPGGALSADFPGISFVGEGYAYYIVSVVDGVIVSAREIEKDVFDILDGRPA